MKDFFKFGIVFVVAFGLGFAGFAGTQIFQRKLRVAVFLEESRVLVDSLDQKIQAFHAARGRYPKDPVEMVALGFWSPADPPMERLRGSAHWVSHYDGEGGFFYDSPTGRVYLNVDLKNDSLRAVDAAELRKGGLVPAGDY